MAISDNKRKSVVEHGRKCRFFARIAWIRMSIAQSSVLATDDRTKRPESEIPKRAPDRPPALYIKAPGSVHEEPITNLPPSSSPPHHPVSLSHYPARKRKSMNQHYTDRLSSTPLGEQGGTTGCRLWFTVPDAPDPDEPWNVIAAPSGSQMEFSWPSEQQRQPEEMSTAVKEHTTLIGAAATVYSWLRLKSEDLARSDAFPSGIEFEDVTDVVYKIKVMAKTRPHRDAWLRAEALAMEDSASTLQSAHSDEVDEPFNKVWFDDDDGDKNIKVSTTHPTYSEKQWAELKRALAVTGAGGRHRWSTATTKSDDAFVRAMPYVVETLSALLTSTL